jgi:adenosylcobinamide-phosphate synthase
MTIRMSLLFLVLAINIDLLLGDPQSWPHPVVYMGKWIKFLENKIRRYMPNRLKLGGILLVVLAIGIVVALSSILLLVSLKINLYLYYAISLYLIYSSLAAKCLRDEVMKIYNSLDSKESISETRRKIGYLVGRDTSELSENEIIRASVETAAENIIDGILAPIFFFVVGSVFGQGVVFILVYKMINTMDSMIGYKNEKYGDIGFCAAKLDDIANYLPARIGSIAIIIAGGICSRDMKQGIRVLKRDRRNHKSPNCGYPEASVAGLLNIQLGGNNVYFGEVVEKPTIGDANVELEKKHIVQTCQLIYISEAVFVIFLLGVILFE